MVYGIEQISKDVRVALNQNGVSDELLADLDRDTLMLDEIIGSKIEEAVRTVHLTAPTHLLDTGHNFGDDDADDAVAVNWREMCSGEIPLPDDFLRLVAFKMSDWERAVYEAITTDSPKYTLQRSRIRGLRGTPQRPVCAISQRPSGRVLEFYSCKSEQATVDQAAYIPEPEFDSMGMIEISEHCYRGAVYTAAALTLSAFGDTKAAGYYELAKSALQ